MLRIGIAGIGFMGMIHYHAARRLEGAKVAAIATRDPKKRAGDWRGIQGNFGPRGARENLAGVQAFATLEEMLASAAVDVVDICLPNDQHAAAAIQALEAGKDVLVEKAIALTLEDADRMLAAARAARRTLLVAHVLPFFPDFGFALDALRDGRLGKLRAAHFRRHISPPDWSADIADLARSGGPVVDLHIHDTHFVVQACGMPKSVSTRGRLRDGVPEYVATHYDFGPGGPVVSACSGAISPPSRPFTHGFEIYFESGALHYEAGGPLSLYTEHGVQHPELGSADPIDVFAKELEYAVNAFEGKGPSELLEGKLARDALALCLKESESAVAGKPVAID